MMSEYFLHNPENPSGGESRLAAYAHKRASVRHLLALVRRDSIFGNETLYDAAHDLTEEFDGGSPKIPVLQDIFPSETSSTSNVAPLPAPAAAAGEAAATGGDSPSAHALAEAVKSRRQTAHNLEEELKRETVQDPEVVFAIEKARIRRANMLKQARTEFGSCLTTIRANFPDMEEVDLARFVVKGKGNVKDVTERLTKTIEWRRKVGDPVNKDMVEKAAVSKAVFMHKHTKDGLPIMVVRGAYYDRKLAPAEEYVLYVCFLMDAMLGSGDDDYEQIAVLVDIRGYEGAPNQVVDVSFLKGLIGCVSAHYPQRLGMLCVFPCPMVAKGVFSMVKPFIDKRTQDKIRILSGPSSVGSPVPSQLFDLLDKKNLHVMMDGEGDGPIEYGL
uniref:CRAL-TRIO domain-containing protein n=1 Tax=Chromera velia CCMP2878 TaxID=1169474 RepID=A0A0G4F9Y0_9ALVE|eukprot:Cvel_15936.t1-p1 / transcript=Cvel_15936.t1 / gene=Cvel_15936 / organism=Chromera_velia_CCMP2878 / gene_product=Phosphatidylinositol transfer protein PDR16, putative / transcript_product=Phosphatidylinositol transfer protein PDR16, putative / location=Cvel_scaffold1205:43095-46473(-) / protein_length=386 / sequence_SO=supercontig / SO=protein_coding / is_pseudo=false